MHVSTDYVFDGSKDSPYENKMPRGRSTFTAIRNWRVNTLSAPPPKSTSCCARRRFTERVPAARRVDSTSSSSC